MNKLSVIFAFSLGAAVGSVVTWKVLQTKYDQLVQEEIESVKAVYSSHAAKETTDEEDPEPDPGFEEVIHKTYSNFAASYDPSSNETKREEEGAMVRPHVIPPEDFGEVYEYDAISLTYYADKVLTDENDEPLDDDQIEEIIGKDSLTHFGEYEDDSVYVRNDALKADYEILADPRKYSDVFGMNAHD